VGIFVTNGTSAFRQRPEMSQTDSATLVSDASKESSKICPPDAVRHRFRPTFLRREFERKGSVMKRMTFNPLAMVRTEDRHVILVIIAMTLAMIALLLATS
jgi:hypothetical protein